MARDVDLSSKILLIFSLGMFLCASLLICVRAEALIYDDFSGSSIDASKNGAFAALGLTDGTNFVRVIRDQNGDTNGPIGVFEVNYNIGGQIQVHYIRTDVREGQLGLYYDGTTVTFYFNETLNPTNGWTNTGWSG